MLKYIVLNIPSYLNTLLVLNRWIISNIILVSWFAHFSSLFRSIGSHLISLLWISLSLFFYTFLVEFFCSLLSISLLSSNPILSQASILDCLLALLSCPHFITLALCLPSTPGPTQTASIWTWCWRASLIACKLTSVCISTDSFSNPVQPLKVPVQDVYGRCLGDVAIDVFSFGVLP